MADLYFDVSSFVDGKNHRITGIPRVIYEVGKRFGPHGAKYVAWNGDAQRFVHVGFRELVERIARSQEMDFDETMEEPATPGGSRPRRWLAGGLSRVVERLPPTWSKYDWWVLRGLWTLAEQHSHVSPRDRKTMARRLGIATDRRRRFEYLDVVTSVRMGIWPGSGLGGVVDFGPADTLVSLSIWWRDGPFKVLDAVGPTLRLVGMFYDLFPIRRPSDISDEDLRRRFRSFVENQLRRADALCADSVYVARDVEAYAREAGIASVPVKAVPLCSELAARVPPTLTARLAALGLAPGGFVPMVATFSPRKNHHWAYELWRRAHEELGDKLPALVFVGQRGWDDDDLFKRIERDGALWNRKLFHLDAATDGEVAWLYGNCAFTIFPSLFEGWGLPVSESLSFGKYCLAADNTSLREAGAGLAFHADTLDGLAWMAEIRRLASEPGYLEGMNARVAAEYRSRTWDDVAGDILEAALGRRPGAGPDTPTRGLQIGAK